MDEIIIGGHLQESSKKAVLKAISGQEALIDESQEEQTPKK